MIGLLSLIAVAGAAVVALTSALAAPAASDAKRRLSVTTGPGLTITLKRAGKEVDYVPRGRHAITVRDTSRSHNVALARLYQSHQRGTWRFGPAKILTSFAFVGTKTVTVMLSPGRYGVFCQRHVREPNQVGRQGMYDYFLVE